MAEFKVKKARPIASEISVPGDKSISHRAVIIAALSNGPCEIDGFLPSEDCLRTVDALRALGVQIDVLEETELGPTKLLVHGRKGRFKTPGQPIDCGNSGTSMRLLCGVLAGQAFEAELTGDASLSKRPMDRVIQPLTHMGARIEARGDNGRPPLFVSGGPLLRAHYTLPVASAQVKSAILFAGMYPKGKTTVTEPVTTRDHTERLLDYFLVKTSHHDHDISIWGRQTPESRDFTVPGDISSAAFWIVTAAAQRGAQLIVKNVGLNKTRTGILDVLVRMGAHISEFVEEPVRGEPYGSLEIHGGPLSATTIEGEEIPNVIDELPILAVAGALSRGTTVIRDAKELRVKETDRIAAVATNLRAMGVEVGEFEDGMEIVGAGRLKGAILSSYGDHRIAMAFAVAGLFAEGETVIKDTECVETSYPKFGDELKRFMSNKISGDLQTTVISSLAQQKALSRRVPAENDVEE